MCGRFGQYNLTAELLQKTFRIDHAPNELVSSFNLAPSQEALSIGENPGTEERNASYLRWGLIPFWVDDPDDFTANLINARAETVESKNSFRKPFSSQRCIIPVNGFYEWKPTEDGKQPYWVYPSDNEVFGFAGLWDVWSDDETDDSIKSFTIITTEANEKMEDVHDRMPVILDEDEYDEWLNPENDNKDNLKSLLDPVESETIQMHPVSKSVNNPSYDQEQCLEPVE